MAQTLVGKGFRTLGFDVSEARWDSAVAAGVERARNVGEVFAQARFVVFSLPSAREVEAVVKAPGGLLERKGANGHRHRHVNLGAGREPALATELAAVGHGFIDAPVSGGPLGASSGNLTMMIGGSEEDVALARPVIESMASKILHVGPTGPVTWRSSSITCLWPLT
jgi:3-hydroxyisobutyrate dehydrogenase